MFSQTKLETSRKRLVKDNPLLLIEQAIVMKIHNNIQQFTVMDS